MKCLLIFPPQWIPTNPYYSIPILSGQLKNAGFEADALDLNIDFYDTILNAEYLNNSLLKAKMEYSLLKDSVNIKENNNILLSDKIKIEKLNILNTYFQNHYIRAQRAIKYIQSAKEILKSDEFYNFNSYYKAHRIIEYALELASLTYAPSKISLLDFSNPLFKANYDDIITQTTLSEVNPYIDFFRRKLQGKVDNYNLILISITGKTNLVPAFTLIKILREEFNCNAHISIGGNLLNRVSDSFLKHPEVFENYVDSISVGNGEDSVIQLAEAIKDNLPLSSVSGIIYKKNNKIVQTPIKPLKNINSISMPDLSNWDLKKYLSPETIVFIQATQGCYWGKCTFCDLSFSKHYSVKNISRLVDEIEIYNKSYNITKFWFVDESISPSYYLDFAKEIIKRKLKINYYGLARLEDNFTKENCKILYESGLRCLMWGYECASERVFKLMNKGIKPENRLSILKNACECKIWNHIFLIFGFPSEDELEANETISTVVNNKDIINTYFPHIFSLQRHSTVRLKHSMFNIENFEEEEEFEECYSNKFEDSSYILSKETAKKKIEMLSTLFWKKEENAIVRYLLSTDFLLYLSKFGYEDIRTMKTTLIKNNTNKYKFP